MTELATTDAGALPVTVRPMDRDPAARELDFVVETTTKVRWPKRSGLPWYEWKALHEPQVQAWVAQGTTMVADAGDGLLLGFVTLSPGTGPVRMLYVKREFRGNGIGLKLLAGVMPGRVLPDMIGACLPTASWKRWCERHALTWEVRR